LTFLKFLSERHIELAIRRFVLFGTGVNLFRGLLIYHPAEASLSIFAILVSPVPISFVVFPSLDRTPQPAGLIAFRSGLH
jgi:hypothetical protein